LRLFGLHVVELHCVWWIRKYGFNYVSCIGREK